MSLKARNLITLLVALLMVLSLSLTGCGSNRNVTGNNAASTGNNTTSASTTQTVEKKKEPVTLKILGPTFEKAFPNGIQDDPVAKELEKKTGVTLDWIVGNGISDPGTYYSTMIASGDLPDIISTGGDAKTRSQLLNSNSVIPLDDLLNTNGQNILKNAPGMIDIVRKYRSKNNDGKSYLIAADVGDDYKSPNALQGIPLIRWDLYKAIGSPKIETLDDLLNVLKQMQDKFSTTPDGKKAYALSGFYGDWGNVMPWYYFSSTLNRVFATGFDYDGTDPDKTYATTDPQSVYILAAELFNKAYNMGILDPDSATMKFEQYLEKVKQGRVYCDIASWSSVDVYNPEAAKQGQPEKGFEPVPGFYTDKPINIYGSQDGGFWEYFISKGCKYPDRAMDLLDYCFTYEGSELIMNGIEGKDYTMANGKPVVSDDVINEKIDGKADPDFRIKTGVAKYGPLLGFGWSLMDPKGFPINFKNSIDIKKKSLTQVDLDYCKTLNLGIPYQPWYEHKDASRTGKYLAVLPAPSGEYETLNNKYTDYFNKNYIKLIFAKDFASERDKYIAGLKALGVDKLTDYYVGLFKETRQKLDNK